MIFNSKFLKMRLQGLMAGIIAVNVVVTFAVVAEVVLVILQERNWQKMRTIGKTMPNHSDLRMEPPKSNWQMNSDCKCISVG